MFGRVWRLPKAELCQKCGQPDNVGDCNHKRLPLADALDLGADIQAKRCPCDALSADSNACGTCYKVVWKERRQS